MDTPITFFVEASTPYGCGEAMRYQWQRRDPLVTNPDAPNAWIDLEDGAGFVNTKTPALLISRPTPAMATGYRCRISGCGCQSVPGAVVFSESVNFNIACPADFNADGGIDGQDIQAFFERWENGC
ncbi:MAG: hypothetical protein JSR77_15170 [Planctomycetes bacterium]|nr:hypothetical protein [Planctomycetota bacterium]